MIVEFQTTLEEFKEAYAAHCHGVQQKVKTVREGWPFLAFYGYVGACLCAADFLDEKISSGGIAVSMLLLFPAVLIVIFDAIYPVVPRARTPWKLSWFVGWAVLLLVGTVGAVVCTALGGSAFWRLTWAGLPPI